MLKKPVNRKLLSRILIISGVLCLLAVAGYELFTYPWATARADGSTLISADLPDPTMPPFDFEFATPRPTSFNNAVSTPANPLGLGSGLQASFVSFDPENAVRSNRGNIAIGILKVARLELSEWIWMGTEEEQLMEGVGFQIGTQFPDEPGNMVLSAHRSHRFKQSFRHLDLMQIGDYVTVKFWGMNYNYQVYEKMVVGNHDVWVMDPVYGEEHVLTLLTCDPVAWIGRRPNRLIVRARLIDVTEAD